jgi:voltage-gated potassium channel
MKSFTALFLHYLRNRAGRRNLRTLANFLFVLAALITLFSIVFHYIMAWEGRDYTWITGVYWTLTVMTTLGFGDVTFESDLGRLFSIVVLLSGTLFMLTLLPFTFIQFFYAPWMEAQAAARAPRELPPNTSGHVILTRYGPVEGALIRRLVQYGYSYVILVPDLDEALRLSDLDLQVVIGNLDDPQTYERVRVQQAALVATTHSDVVNTNVAFTVRESSPKTPIVATALAEASVDILELAGCNRVLQLAEMMGQSLARRVTGRDARSHVVGKFDGLLIAEAGAANTPLVGRTLRDIRLPDHCSVNVVGVWERGKFHIAGPDTTIHAHTVLVLAGTREQLDAYDSLFCIYHESAAPVVILGGGRVGQAVARALVAEGTDYRIVEKAPDKVPDVERLVVGDAAELRVLQEAGIATTPAVVITTHDDDLNIYLSIYCRRLQPELQVLSRATQERNVSTLHRAGADFVLSYASMGANAIFNLLRRTRVLLMAEGVDAFKVDVPPKLAGRSLRDTEIRQATGCNVIGLETEQGLIVNPQPGVVLPAGAKMILIGSAEAEEKFLDQYVRE